jgi:hypothetical protein
MKTIKVRLENCYGIKKLSTELDFSHANAIAVYAPNGSMKTSLAQTFKDLREGTDSQDRVFPDRKTTRAITDEKGKALPKDDIFIISPYDEEYGHTEKTSTLLVDSKLRKEYEQLLLQVETSKQTYRASLAARGTRPQVGGYPLTTSLSLMGSHYCTTNAFSNE